MQSFEHGDSVALLGQLSSSGHACRAGTDNSDLDAVGFDLLGHGVDVLTVPVSCETLQTADGNGLTLDAADAVALTLALLGADTAGQGGQSVGGGDDLVSSLEIAFLDLADELGDADINGAAADTLGVLALQAAVGFLDSLLGGVAQGDFLKVAGTDLGILLGHGGLLQRHVSHYSFLL